MPYILINKLKELMSMEFPSQQASDNPVLGTGTAIRDDDVLDKIDEVCDTAKQLFGQRIQPTPHQMRIMEENGFSISYTPATIAKAGTAYIHTPKGLIAYH